MSDLGNRANVNSAIDLLLDDTQPNEAIQPSDHNTLLKNILDTLANGLSTILRTSGQTNGENIIINGGSQFLFNNVFDGDLQSDTLSAVRNWILPDASGTIALISDVFTAGSGITENAGQIDLGGTLTIDAIINGAGNRTLKLGTNVLNENLSILEKNSIQAFERYANSFPFVNSGLEITKNPGNFIGNLKSSATDYVQFRLTSDEFLVNSILGTNNLAHQSSSTLSQTIVSDTSGGTSSRLELYGSGRVNLGTNGSVGASIVLDSVNTFTDRNTTAKGLEYALDYSANYTDRSLVDKAFVLANAGGDSVYTADGTLTGDRTIDMSSYTLSFDGSDVGSITTNFNGRTAFISNRTNAESNILEVQDKSNNRIFEVRQNNSVHINAQGAGDVVLGNDTLIGIEDISLQGQTAIKGIGTAGSSALAIYDNDTTPNKLWDFLDNGNIIANQNPNFKGVNTSAYQLSFCRPVNIVNYGAGFSMDLLNSSGNQVSYGQIFSTIVSGTTGSEYGYVSIFAMKNGTPTVISKFDSVDGLTINDVTSTNLFKAGNVLTVSKTDVTSKGGYIPLNVYQPVGANNYGVGFEFNLNNSLGVKTAYGLINSVIVDSTSGSEDGKMNLQVKENGSLTTKMTLKTNTINVPNLPTSATGLVTGDVWSQNGTVKIGNPSANITTVASVSTLTVNADTTEMAKVLALATNITINAPTGTPNDNQTLWFRILDNGTSQTITLNAVFEDYTGNFPTSTTAGKYLIFAGKWNADEGKWNILAWKVQP